MSFEDLYSNELMRLTGKSGEAYIFVVSPYSATFFAKPGVYVLGKSDGDNRYRFCYVAETHDMSIRPFNPAKTECFKSFGVDLVFHFEEVDETRRKNVVGDLLQAYGPICNTP